MEKSPRRWPLLALALIAGCSDRFEATSPEAVLAGVGKRLARSRSLDDLAAIASRGDRVLAALTRAERDALGRSALRFRVDRPSIVAVAAHPRAIPFWLADLGFARLGETMIVAGERWPVFEKRFPDGAIGLGVNGLDRSPPSHYVVLVRAESGTAPVSIFGLDPADDWRAIPARSATSAASGVRLAIERLPTGLRGATLLQPSHDRRHAVLLARGRIWKTHVPSGHAPDQVAVSFGADASRGLAWTWRTGPEVAETTLRLAPADDPSRVRVVRGGSQLVASPDLLNDPLIRRHRVVADGLEPGTAYAYSIDAGATWRTVRTAPEAPGRFRLLYMGDPQCGLEAWGELLRAARRRFPDAGALLIAGDLVDRGNERTNWDHFFLRASGVFDALPVMPCAGNHEYLDRGPVLYRAAFATPSNGPDGLEPGLCYAFEYADAFIAVLDSTRAVCDPKMARLQVDWLDAALARTRATWRLVMFHHPVYASHPRRESSAWRDAIVPVLDRHRVDLVLQGHDHAYLRTFPLRGGRRVGNANEGTVYVVSVSGTKYTEQSLRDYAAVGLEGRSTYQTLDFDAEPRRLTLRAWDFGGAEVDRVVFEKPGAPKAPALHADSSW